MAISASYERILESFVSQDLAPTEENLAVILNGFGMTATLNTDLSAVLDHVREYARASDHYDEWYAKYYHGATPSKLGDAETETSLDATPEAAQGVAQFMEDAAAAAAAEEARREAESDEEEDEDEMIPTGDSAEAVQSDGSVGDPNARVVADDEDDDEESGEMPNPAEAWEEALGRASDDVNPAKYAAWQKRVVQDTRSKMLKSLPSVEDEGYQAVMDDSDEDDQQEAPGPMMITDLLTADPDQKLTPAIAKKMLKRLQKTMTLMARNCEIMANNVDRRRSGLPIDDAAVCNTIRLMGEMAMYTSMLHMSPQTIMVPSHVALYNAGVAKSQAKITLWSTKEHSNALLVESVAGRKRR